jgi:ribosomal protein S1
VAKKTSKKSSVKKVSSLTMDDLLEKYGGQVRALQRGQKVAGKVIDKTLKRLVVNINRKSEGLVAEKAFNEAKDYIRTLEVGDEIVASVIIPETPEGYTILSLRGAQEEASWQKIEKAQKEDLPLVVHGKSAASSGVMVEIDGLTGFIPNSQLGKVISKNPKDLINEHFKVKILEIDRKINKIVLSEKEVSDAEDIKIAKLALKKIKAGDIYEGIVTNIMNFGCFVKIHIPFEKKKKVSVEGLVHISEISWDKVDNISKVCEEGKKVKVKVIGVEGNKLSLSMKQARDDPWKKADKKYGVDSKHKGSVVKLSDFGVFVQLEPGIEGLIHITKIPPGTKLENGQKVNIYVEEINSKAKKLSLGLVLTTKPVGYK